MTRAAAAALATLGGVFGGAAAAQECRAERIAVEAPSGALTFAIEIADDPAERARGLMHREHLPRDAGMLFLYDAPQPMSFWMKNTPLPLDILFIDARGVICGLAERTTPFSLRPIPSGCDALAALEVNAGIAAEAGIARGARVRHPAFGPDAAWPCDAAG